MSAGLFQLRQNMLEFRRTALWGAGGVLMKEEIKENTFKKMPAQAAGSQAEDPPLPQSFV